MRRAVGVWSLLVVGVPVICTSLPLLGSRNAFAQQWSPQPPEKRCPSPWGASDERGAANHMKPETVLKGIRLVKEGKMYELGRVLEPAMPTFGARRFGIHTARSSGPIGTNQIRGNEELVVTELGQVGTQFDALSHIAIGDMLYNCVKTDEVATPSGFTKLGILGSKAGGAIYIAVNISMAAAISLCPSPSGIFIGNLENPVGGSQGPTPGA
jgi:hypothetical protein